jgi:hypothetical protein
MYALGLLALFLFILGFGFSYFVEKFDIGVLKAFPVWFLRQTARFGNPQRPFLFLFLFIFLFNSIAICFYMLSGLLVLFPVLIAFLTGTNIGIIVLHPIPEDLKEGNIYRSRKEVKLGPFLMILAALVPLLELFVFCISMAMGLEMASEVFLRFPAINGGEYIRLAFVLAIPRLKTYLMVCVPLLFVSALAEARVIKEFK